MFGAPPVARRDDERLIRELRVCAQLRAQRQIGYEQARDPPRPSSRYVYRVTRLTHGGLERCECECE